MRRLVPLSLLAVLALAGPALADPAGPRLDLASPTLALAAAQVPELTAEEREAIAAGVPDVAGLAAAAAPALDSTPSVVDPAAVDAAELLELSGQAMANGAAVPLVLGLLGLILLVQLLRTLGGALHPLLGHRLVAVAWSIIIPMGVLLLRALAGGGSITLAVVVQALLLALPAMGLHGGGKALAQSIQAGLAARRGVTTRAQALDSIRKGTGA